MFTAAEKEIMKCLWRSGGPMSVEEVRAWLEENRGKQWVYKTVQSFLTILLKKGYVQYEKKGRRFYYSCTVSEQEFLKQQIKELCDFGYDGSMDKMLVACTEYEGVSQETIEKMKEMVRRLECASDDL